MPVALVLASRIWDELSPWFSKISSRRRPVRSASPRALSNLSRVISPFCKSKSAKRVSDMPVLKRRERIYPSPLGWQRRQFYPALKFFKTLALKKFRVDFCLFQKKQK